MLSAIKMAKYYEMDEHDVVLPSLTDSMQLYQSRLKEMHDELANIVKWMQPRILHNTFMAKAPIICLI